MSKDFWRSLVTVSDCELGLSSSTLRFHPLSSYRSGFYPLTFFITDCIVVLLLGSVPSTTSKDLRVQLSISSPIAPRLLFILGIIFLGIIVDFFPVLFDLCIQDCNRFYGV